MGRSPSDLLLAILQACEEISAVTRLIGEAEGSSLRDLQSAARMIGRTARVAEERVCELMEAQERRRPRPRAERQHAGRRQRAERQGAKRQKG